MSLSSQSAVAALVRQSVEANTELMQGDAERYHAMMRWTDDFVLFSPFGGTPSRGRDYTAERVAAMGRFFRNGVFRQEVVEAWGTADMVTLATIEHAHVEIGGLPAQDWALRVTLVFRREDESWRLVHRHASPLVSGISLQQAAALARGEQPQSVLASATS
jgi:uncharacterized protein (TIGR02246 family)